MYLVCATVKGTWPQSTKTKSALFDQTQVIRRLPAHTLPLCCTSPTSLSVSTFNDSPLLQHTLLNPHRLHFSIPSFAQTYVEAVGASLETKHTEELRLILPACREKDVSGSLSLTGVAVW